LKSAHNGSAPASPIQPQNGQGGLLVAPPKARLAAEASLDFYLAKQKIVAVRHISDDDVVAIAEIVSPGNNSSQKGLQSFISKAAYLVDKGVHLLLIDLIPPTPRDANGIHGVLWSFLTGQSYSALSDKPLTLAAYECAETLRAYVEPVAVGDRLLEMPLFLRPGRHVVVPLEETYEAAWRAFPRRWQRVVEGK
jgi:hypothetical protein